ncbi:F-box/kelch-repeat protein At3g23880-like [Neltuma alba]|uniref:F-box/kelch-repeat protein At3g23880-like n=1 Tax=Neltuma alba TaxID=207710 RepID=UPI0010A4C823|nr:F-box/kelch-repeat protein At3g23880-like [Prosopis alba]
MDGDNPFLCDDITANILKRLNVRCILRFRCVCKRWKNLIKSPSFIEAHLRHSSNQRTVLLWPTYGNDNPLPLYLSHCGIRIFKRIKAPVAADGVKIIDSSNGLLCFKIVDDVSSPPSLLLWNLATREIRQVPRSINSFQCDCICGFGFSPIVNDYKIVKAHVNKSRNVNGVEVYSLGSGSWKEVEFENLQGVSVTHSGEAVTANGVMYWLGTSHMILSFDVATEVFALIAKPLLFISLLSTLSIFENKLALLFLSSAYFIELWVMEEFTSGISREKWKWTKTHSIGPFPRLLRPVTIWRNEVVCHDVVMPRLEAETGELTNILYVFDLTSVGYRMANIGKCFHVFHLTPSYVLFWSMVDENSISSFV